MNINLKIAIYSLCVISSPLPALAQSSFSAGATPAEEASPATWAATPITVATGVNAPVTGDCDPTVHQGFVNASKGEIRRKAALASGIFKYLPGDGTFLDNSCLGNLLNGSLDVLFEPPNLDALLGQIIQAGCDELANLKQQALQPVYTEIGTADSAESQDLNFGSPVPGVNLGGLPNVLSVQNDSGGQGLVQTNITSMFTDSRPAPILSNAFQNGLFGDNGQ